MRGVNIKKGDEVQIIAGKELGARGRVLEVQPRKRRVIVEGISRATRHEKITQAQGRAGQQGGISHKEAAIDISNVAIVCPTDGPTRIGYRIEDSGAKLRVCTKCGTEL
jgi:large subunit ribosomal protein L24